MRKVYFILLFTGFFGLFLFDVTAQTFTNTQGIIVKACIDKGDTIPCVEMRTLYVYPPYRFKNRREQIRYNKLVRDVKKTLPIAKMIDKTINETYDYLERSSDKKERKRHIKRVEKGLKEQYTPMMKKLTFSQGKLLIRLVDRECNQSSYELVKAFMGPFKAGFYQTFASLFGASLKKEYNPEKEDQMTERIINLVESEQL